MSIVFGVVITLGAVALGWFLRKPAARPNPVQTAQDKQDQLKPVEQAIEQATTPAEVADQWNNLLGGKRP